MESITDLQQHIRKRLTEIEDLGERKDAREILLEGLVPIFELMEKRYLDLENQIKRLSPRKIMTLSTEHCTRLFRHYCRRIRSRRSRKQCPALSILRAVIKRKQNLKKQQIFKGSMTAANPIPSGCTKQNVISRRCRSCIRYSSITSQYGISG